MCDETTTRTSSRFFTPTFLLSLSEEINGPTRFYYNECVTKAKRGINYDAA